MLSAGELSAGPRRDQLHLPALSLGIPGPEPAGDRLRRLPSLAAPQPSSSRGGGMMGSGISRTESHQREADGKETSKRAPAGLPVHSHRSLVDRFQPAPRKQAGRAAPRTLRSSDLKLPFARSAPGFRFPPPPPAPRRPARRSYSRPSSLQSSPPP